MASFAGQFQTPANLAAIQALLASQGNRLPEEPQAPQATPSASGPSFAVEKPVFDIIEGAIGAGATDLAPPAAIGQLSPSGAFVPASAVAEGGALSGLFPSGSAIGGFGTLGQVALPIAGIAGGANLVSNFGELEPAEGALSGAAAGAAIGSLFPGPGTIIGGLGGALIGGINEAFGSGKGEDQVARDKVRGHLQKVGLLDKDFNIGLASGAGFNLGEDGRNSFLSADGSKEIRNGFEVDDTSEFTPQTIGFVNPLATILTGGNPKLRSDFASQFTNAAISDAKDIAGARQNALSFYNKLGLDREKAIGVINFMAQKGAVSAEDRVAFVNGINQVFGAAPLNQDASKGGPGSEGQIALDTKFGATKKKKRPLIPIDRPITKLPDFQVSQAPVPPPVDQPDLKSVQEFEQALIDIRNRSRGAQNA